MPRTLCFVVALLSLLAADASGQQKKRVAVLSFDDAAVAVVFDVGVWREPGCRAPALPMC